MLRRMISSATRSQGLLLLAFVLLFGACGELQKLTRAEEDEPSTEVARKLESDDPAYHAGLLNTGELLQSVNMTSWVQRGFHGRSQTIAILDNGFAGLSASRGKHLPPDLSVFKGPLDNEGETLHGTKLAEVIFAMTSGSPNWSERSQHPTIKLYNANGFSNFSASVDQAIKDRVNIIVYSQVWEFGGNFDGRGFINAAVNKATSAGIVWINAAGNYATSSWQGPLIPNPDYTARLPFESRYVRMVVNEPSTPVKIILSWNDFSDSKDWRTARNLDLVLLDKNGRELASARKIQDGIDHGRSSSHSGHARESIETTLQPGIYLLRVDIRSNNFDLNSRIRIAANGPDISFVDQSTDASVMIPADNPTVLTVGASDDSSSSFGRTSGGAQKPEVLAPSILQFERDISFQGSSSAAAVAAAAIAVFRDACGSVNRALLVQKINDGFLSQASEYGRGLWLPPSGQCR